MTTEYERESLLQAICAAPSDDVPRLVYADWLEEQGETARAQFIRDQIHLASLPKWHTDVLADAQLNPNGYFAYSRNQPDKFILPGLPAGFGWSHREMRRGFANAVQTETVAALRDGLALLCQTTPIDSVAVKARYRESNTELIRELTEIPALACVRRLEISLAMLTPEQLQMLDACPYLAQLDVLDLPFGGLGSRGAIELPTLGLFRRLRELHLSSTDYSDPAGPAFAPAYQEHGDGSCLQVLNLATNHLGPADLQILANSPALASVRELYLSGCAYNTGFRAEGYQTFATSRYVQQIEILSLGNTEPTLGGVQALAGGSFPKLRSLDLSDNGIGPKGIAQLVTAPWLHQLTNLSLQANPVKNSGLKHLLQARLPNLVALNLRETQLSDEGLLSLADAPIASQLQQLNLYGSTIEKKATGQRLQAVFGDRVSMSGQY